MSASLAQLGYGAVFAIEDDSTPGQYNTIEETFKAGGPNQKLDTKDVSNFQSPNEYKEFIAGMREGGEFTWEGNYLPKQTVQAQVLADFQAGTKKNFKLTLPGSLGVWTFAGLITALTPSEPLDDRMTYSGAIKISGKPVLT